MRSDISKCIVERPRYKAYNDGKGHSKYEVHDIEDHPHRESMKHRHSSRKEFSDFLAPLEEFLAQNVGRSWDKIFSEVCEHLRPTRTTDLHVLQHLWQDVEVCPMAVQLPGGKIVYRCHNGHTIGKYYVCLKTGLLCKSKKEWRRYVFDPQSEWLGNQEYHIINNVAYRKMSGFWYELILANVPKEIWGNDNMSFSAGEKIAQELGCWDIGLKAYVTRWNCYLLGEYYGERNLQNKLISPEKIIEENKRIQKIYGFCINANNRSVYAKARRQLSAKEIRHLGLNEGKQSRLPDIVRGK